MGYEAKGDSTTDVVYYLFDKHGKKLEECWFNAPYVGMMHDMAATDKWIVFILPPLAELLQMSRYKQGTDLHVQARWQSFWVTTSRESPLDRVQDVSARGLER